MYLYSVGVFVGTSIIGLKERTIEAEPPTSTITKSFIESQKDIISFAQLHSIEEAFPKDMISVPDFIVTGMIDVLEPTIHLLLSRMKNLKELYLLDRALSDYRRTLDEILPRAPFVEKPVLDYSRHRLTEFIRALSDPSLCPRLNHLSFITSTLFDAFHPREAIEAWAEEVGTLTECLQSRHKLHGQVEVHCPSQLSSSTRHWAQGIANVRSDGSYCKGRPSISSLTW